MSLSHPCELRVSPLGCPPLHLTPHSAVVAKSAPARLRVFRLAGCFSSVSTLRRAHGRCERNNLALHIMTLRTRTLKRCNPTKQKTLQTTRQDRSAEIQQNTLETPSPHHGIPAAPDHSADEPSPPVPPPGPAQSGAAVSDFPRILHPHPSHTPPLHKGKNGWVWEPKKVICGMPWQ